jgi:ABC-2 type transport system permease protein
VVRLLVRLKLVLLRRGVRTSGGRATVGIVLSLVFALVVGGSGAATFAALRSVESDVVAGDLVALAAGFVLVFWSLGPLITGSESTLEPERLLLLPLRPERLMPGLLAAGVVGFGGLATVLSVLGLVAGTAPASPLALVTVAAAMLLVATCVACSRLVATALSAAVRRRRLRDIALFAGPLAGVALSVTVQLLPRALAGADDSIQDVAVPAAVRVVTRLLPSGPSAVAIASAREGDIVVALAALLAGIVLLVVVLRAWSVMLGRVLTTASDVATASPGRRRALLGGAFALLPRNRFGAVMAKELRLSWRDPRQRAALVSAIFPGVFPLVGVVASSSGTRPALVLLACAPAFVVGATSTNLYGFDGGAHWTDVAAGARSAIRTDLAAKAAARVVVMVPLVVIGITVLGAIGGTWSRAPLAVAVAVAAAGVTLGAGVVGSVRAPLPLPDTPSNPFSTGNAGQGMAVAGSGCLTLLVTGALVAPLGIAAAAVGGRLVPAVAIGIVSIAVGFGAWRLGLGLAVRRAEGREPELLGALEAAR